MSKDTASENTARLQGSCLCGEVRYTFTKPFKLFQYCHCSRCRKVSGTVHGANIFIFSDQFQWLAGEDKLTHYRFPDAKHFGSTFCKACGSAMPWTTADTKTTIVPAGGVESLDESPTQSIFWDSHAEWYKEPSSLPAHAALPERKPKA